MTVQDGVYFLAGLVRGRISVVDDWSYWHGWFMQL
jgi:hypothetical protein